jgi:hypothetical protein
MSRRNRIGNTERLIMALRNPNGEYSDFLLGLKKYRVLEVRLGHYIEGSILHTDLLSTIGDLIEEAMEFE